MAITKEYHDHKKFTSLATNVRAIPDADYTVQDDDYTINCKNFNSDHEITLPSASTCSGRILVVMPYNNGSAYSFSEDVIGYESSNVNSGTNITIGVTIQSDGVDWLIIGVNNGIP